MNIFLTDPCPIKCAEALDDRRLVKMVLETAQLVSTTCNVLVPDHNSKDLYKTTHYNHPCALFPRRGFANFDWLTKHGLALSDEYTFRYGKLHASSFVFEEAFQVLSKGRILTHIADYMTRPLKFTFNSSGFDTGNVFQDYRLCMQAKWSKDGHLARWTGRNKPDWS